MEQYDIELRDIIATAAMQALIPEHLRGVGDLTGVQVTVAKSYAYAVAMMAERSRLLAEERAAEREQR